MVGDYDLIRFFLEDIYDQAQGNLYSNDINVLEYFVRRLDDHIFVIQSVLYQCLCMQTTGIDNLIDLLFNCVAT